MNEPEPVDEKMPVPVEVRGGDRDEDFMEQLPLLPVPGPDAVTVTDEDE